MLCALAFLTLALRITLAVGRSTCNLKPLGGSYDDTEQVEAAIKECGQNGTTVFEHGEYNITRKMTWNLVGSQVHLNGYLSFTPDIPYWLNANNTYRVVFIQDQASWFVLTGNDFIVDGHSQGGINGNGQSWWAYHQSHMTTEGRPISLTLSNVTRGIVRNFRVEAPPSWCNTIAQSKDVLYDGMYCNATNQDPAYAAQNTDGINTYRSDNVTMLNWDITSGDDCLAVKGNSTNIHANGITCRGGNGIAVGSLGQYVEFPDIVKNLTLENIKLIRLNATVQPNMQNGVYLKTWTGTVNGVPPSGGGGAGGYVTNVIAKNVQLDRVNTPVHLYQTNGGHSADLPSQLQFSNLTFVNWTGTANTNKVVDIECSSAVPCPGVAFTDFYVSPPNGTAPRYICKNVVDIKGLSAPCNSTGMA